jgi:NitT/TauT family transport system substrate-binding protein
MKVAAQMIVIVVVAAVLATCRKSGDAATDKIVLRVGHFPNITHAQALVAHSLSRHGQGWFEPRLGRDVTIEWYVFNAGPSATEGIFAGSIDLTYVGPNPALNAYTKSRGEEVRILAGSARGGAALVVHSDDAIASPEDFRGKKIATPQLGNTQDVACRSYLAAHGFHVTQQGGDVLILPTANPDQLTLFAAHKVDAVWTVEPWVSRLEMEGGGKVFLDEPEAVTTVLTSSVKLLKDRRELAHKFVAAHRELTEWLKANPKAAQTLLIEEIKAETGKQMPAELVTRAWQRLHFTSEISLAPLEKTLADAQAAGFITDRVDLARLIETP